MKKAIGMIMVVGGVGALGYMLYKNFSSGMAAPVAAEAPAPVKEAAKKAVSKVAKKEKA